MRTTIPTLALLALTLTGCSTGVRPDLTAAPAPGAPVATEVGAGDALVTQSFLGAWGSQRGLTPSVLVLEPDGSYRIVALNEIVTSGTWSLSGRRLTLTTAVGSASHHTIRTLTADRLEIIPHDLGGTFPHDAVSPGATQVFQRTVRPPTPSTVPLRPESFRC